jgi:hypothetical protein
LIIKGSGWLYVFLLDLLNRQIPPADYGGVVFVVLLGVWLFYIPFRALDYLPIPGKGNFYSLSALLLGTAGLLLAAGLDFTYAPVFVWVVFFSFLGFFFKRPALILTSAFFIPLQALGAIINLMQTGQEELPKYFFNYNHNTGWMAAIQIAIIFLPFMLLIKKAALFFHRPREKSWNIRLMHRFVLLALIFGAILVYALFLPGKEKAPLRLSGEDPRFSISFENLFFEESRILELSLKAPGNPVRFDLFLESFSGRPLVYSAPAPFVEEEGVISFTLGETPPNPFSLEIVLPADFSGEIRAEALYTAPPDVMPSDAASVGEEAEGDYLLRLKTRRDISPEQWDEE